MSGSYFCECLDSSPEGTTPTSRVLVLVLSLVPRPNSGDLGSDPHDRRRSRTTQEPWGPSPVIRGVSGIKRENRPCHPPRDPFLDPVFDLLQQNKTLHSLTGDDSSEGVCLTKGVGRNSDGDSGGDLL